MGRPVDKWFSLQADFFGRDAHVLGFLNLSPQAMALYICSAAYASRWGVDFCYRNHAVMVGVKKPAPAIRELVECGFWIPALESKTKFYVAHEGILWRRGSPTQRRTIPVAVRAAVMNRDGYACVECGATEDLSLDHIFPYSRGGQDTVENLRVLCKPCNSAKGARVDGS